MKVSIKELESLTLNILKKQGYNKEESSIIRDILFYSQLRGGNQGIVKLLGSGIPKRDHALAPTIEKQTSVSILLNGNATNAMLVMNQLVELAIEKANSSGIAIAGNYNTLESTGALGYYVDKIAKHQYIGIAFASAPFMTTAPEGSYEAKFCTNPIAFAVPTYIKPIILDMSTSAIAYYGLIEAKTQGKKLDKDLGFDHTGSETNDPASIMAGAIKTFGGYKGSGLALMVQILAGALVKADSFDNDSNNAGNLILVINPDLLSSRQHLLSEVKSIQKSLKNSKKLPGVDEIRLPGERSQQIYNQAVSSGQIEIDDQLFKSLQAVSK